MASPDAALGGFREIRLALDDRTLRASELTEAVLERIGRLDGELHTQVDLDAAGAVERAAQADAELDAGKHLGPLHGIPIGVKETIGVEGKRFTGGAYAFDGLRAQVDATVIARARAGGAVILGMHAMSENAMGGMIPDGERATGRNPRHADYAPGGSSSGTAAATAAGFCVVGFGADGGGSVRNPAAACGVVGFKPTEHRLPKDGCHPWTTTMMTTGAFSRDVEGAARGFDVIAETDSRLERATPPRLGLLRRDDLGELDQGVENALSDAAATFAASGATVVDAPPVDLAVGDAWFARLRELAHAHVLPMLTSPEGYSAGMRELMNNLDSVPVDAYVASFETAAKLRAQLDAALDTVDALLLPANPWPAMRWEEWASPRTFDWYRFSWPLNLSWHPGVTIPWALDPQGLPLAYQLIGRLNHDEDLLSVAAWCEGQTSFDRAPVPA